MFWLNVCVRTESSHFGVEAHGGGFATTHWSVVVAAGEKESIKSTEALEQLCRTYWYPLYAFVRRWGYGIEDAEDLTQAFFVRLLRKDFLNLVGPEKGKFRSFLLACLKHFVMDEWEKARAVKRGGGRAEVLLDLTPAEKRYRLEAQARTAESLYERRWALDLLDHVLDRLRREAGASGGEAVFAQLQSCLLGERPAGTYAEIGAGLGMSEAAVKVRVHRLRQRYRELLREEIGHTVAGPEEIDEEMRYLFEIVGR